MIPVSVRLSGFMSYRDEQELRFDEEGLWVLEGENGVGKSTIFDAITFVLFDQHRLGQRNTEELINHGSDRMEVELTLQLGSGRYRLLRALHRGRQRRTWQVSQEDAAGKYLPVAGTEQKKGYEDWVQKNLGLDYNAFTCCVLLLQGESEKLLREDPAGRRKVLAQLLELSRYERLHERAKAILGRQECEAERLKHDWAGVPEVSEAALEEAAARLAATEQERAALEAQLEARRGLLPGAEHRDRLLGAQRALSQALAQEQDVLLRAEEIRARLGEHERLSGLLPPLRGLAAARASIRKHQGDMEEAAALQARALEREEEAAAQVKQAAQQGEALASQQEALRGQKEALAAQQEPLLLDQRLLDRVRDAGRQLAEAEAALPALSGAPGLEQAERAQEERQEAAARVKAEQEMVSRRLRGIDALGAQLADAGAKVTCEACGQPVTAAHAAAERGRLLAREGELVAQAREEAKALALARAQHGQARRRRAAEELLARVQANYQRVLEGRSLEELVGKEAALQELKAQLAVVEQEMEARRRAQGQQKAEAQKATAALERCRGERLQAERAQGPLRDGLQKAEGRLAALREQLPPELHEVEAEQVQEMEGRVGELAPYRDLGARLSRAERGEAAQRQAAIQRELDGLSPELPKSDALRGEIERLQAQRKEAERRWEGSTEDLRLQKGHRARKAELWERYTEAERERARYDLLVRLLGPRQLQRYLVREAEGAIVQLANQELRGLSGGRIHLSLRQDRDEEDTTRALDLLLHNQETGEQPTDLRLASGSQKFRIAISLALAIGQYLARETRRVESVIIDEGFGCLDRASREEAVVVLQELSKRLQRVILVSHQEEFTGRFRGGYRIALVDQSSVPTRVSR